MAEGAKGCRAHHAAFRASISRSALRPDFQGEALNSAIVIRPYGTSDEAPRLARIGIDDKVPPLGLEGDTVAGSDFLGNGDIGFPASAYSPKADFIEPRWEPLLLAKTGLS